MNNGIVLCASINTFMLSILVTLGNILVKGLIDKTIDDDIDITVHFLRSVISSKPAEKSKHSLFDFVSEITANRSLESMLNIFFLFSKKKRDFIAPFKSR